MRKKVNDPQMLEGLRAQVLRQWDSRLNAALRSKFPIRTVLGVLGISERDIGVEIEASEGVGTEFRLFVSFQIDDQEAILDGVNLIPLAEVGGVKRRQLWGNRERQKEFYLELAKATSEKERSQLLFDAVRTGKIRKGDFKVSLILDYEAAAGTK